MYVSLGGLKVSCLNVFLALLIDVGLVFPNKIYKMKKVIIRKDLMSKKEYSDKYGINRVTLDKKIEDGLLTVEQISGVDYIKLITK